MKQWINGLTIGMMALVLFACSNTADVAIEDVFEKALEASKKVESMQVNNATKQNMKSDAIGIDMDTDITMVIELIKEPMSMHQVMEVGLDKGDIEKMQTEIYMADEGLFMKEPMSDNWISLPTDMFDEVSASMGIGENPTLDLFSLTEYIGEFTLEQNDEQYVLSLDGSGEAYKGLMLEVLGFTGVTAGMGEEESEILENMLIHQLDYELFIDKKTFDTTAFNLTMDMEIGEEGEEIRITQKVVATISRINEIQKIEIPDEVLKSAVEE